MRLYETAGDRLYLNAEERAAFLAVARCKPARERTLCETLHFTACRECAFRYCRKTRAE